MSSGLLMLGLIVASAVESTGATTSPQQERTRLPFLQTAVRKPAPGSAAMPVGPRCDPANSRGGSGYAWVLCEVPPSGPPRPVGGRVGMWPTFDLVAPRATVEGQAAFISLFDAAVAKGVENAVIRVFNNTRVLPDGRGGSSDILPPLPEQVPPPGAGAGDPGVGPQPTRRGSVPSGAAPPGVHPAAGPPPRPGSSHTPLEQVWYSGASADKFCFDFSGDPPKILREAPARPGLEPGGTASFTDPSTGRLRLYTDGQTLFNGQTHAPLEDGTALGGGGTTGEPALIVPAPGPSRDLFYLLTNDAGRISYCVADLSAGPHGKVVLKDQPLAADAGEALGVVPHRDGRSLWVLVFHTAARLDAYKLDASSGIAATPVSSPTGFVGAIGRGSIVHAPAYDTLALGVGGRGIAIARIDLATGELTEVNRRVLGSVGAASAFSPDGTKLYFARGDEGASGTPWQLDLRSGRETALSSAGGFCGPKLAPDGKVYWTGLGKPFLSAVEDPDAEGEAARFTLWAVGLQGARGTSHLPKQTAAFLDYLPEELRPAARPHAVAAPPGQAGPDVVPVAAGPSPAHPVAGGEPASRAVATAPGQVAEGVDLGHVAGPGKVAEIRGTRWHDLNANGTRDPGEPSLPGVTMYVDFNGDGVLNPSEPSTVTDQGGRYRFPGLSPGRYTVREMAHDGPRRTIPTTAGRPAKAGSQGSKPVRFLRKWW